MKLWPKLRFILIAAVLLLSGYLGIQEGINTVGDAGSVGQKVAAMTQLLYGIFAVAAFVSALAKHRWDVRAPRALGPHADGDGGDGSGRVGRD
jgi:hypothetical protein